MRRWQRRVVVWAVTLACVGWLVFQGWQGWQATASLIGVVIGLTGMQALLRWEKRGKR